jgi:hypothetical protein
VSPLEEYRRREADHQRELERRRRQGTALSWARFSVVVLTLILAWLVVDTGIVHPGWLTAPIAVFVVLVNIHARVAGAEERARRARDFFRDGTRRLGGGWIGAGVPGQGFADASHPHALDLDLFGVGSLFELLCTARTASGERALAGWLTTAAPVAEVVERQRAISELAPRLDLRLETALLGDDIRSAVDPEGLAAWGLQPPRSGTAVLRMVAILISLLTGVSLVGWIGLGWGPLPVVAAVLVHGSFAFRQRSWAEAVCRAVYRPARELDLLARLLAVVEGKHFSSPWLARTAADLDTGGRPPSLEVRRLQRLVHLLDSRRNMLFVPFAEVLLWSVHLAAAIDRWRRDCGPALATWFEVIGRFEAANAVAGYAFEHPEDVFPELVDGGPVLEAEGIVHPLLPAATAVRNDVIVGGEPRVLVVSGSNMSGKTTLLRTLGVNLVLAFAGAPVRARRLRVSPLALGASIASRDSLLEGRSRFYAEIGRIKQIFDLCEGDRPVLFLVDEILAGTNSHDRRAGVEILVRSLLERGACGLLTTHDLALSRLADSLAPEVANVHFEDRMEGGTLLFDYRLRPGTVTRSNALELMRAIGLPVD